MSEFDGSSESEGSTHGHANTTTAAGPSLDELLQRCTTLITELEAFKEHLKSRRLEHTVEIAHFRNTVKSELKTLQRLSTSGGTKSKEVSQHTVNSSNLPFLETVWSTVKNTTGLQALQKRFYWHFKPQPSKDGINAPKPLDKRKQSALVDIVAKDGLEWTKVSLITNNRLLFDKAKQGWEDEPSSSEDSSSDNEQDTKSNASSADGDSQIPLVRMTTDLLHAARTIKIRTKHPRVTLILPKIQLGQIREIDALITSLRTAGAIVICSDSIPPVAPLSDVMTTLLTDQFAALTATLNIDCTILLALVSDFSHCAVDAEPWFHRALKRQVEIEDKENLLPNLLYPALAGKKLVCTKEASKRMREIVGTIGTSGEKARTALLMGDDGNSTPGQLRESLQEWTRFEVPADLLLPIETLDSGDDGVGELPVVAEKVRENLSDINKSVFLFGWARGWSTITSNRTVVKQIERLLDEGAESESDWPSIWLCPTARSLVGKEKGRRE